MKRSWTNRARRQVAAIHVLKHQLGLDDDTYRDVLERVTGKRSAAALDAAGRSRALNELRRLTGESRHHAQETVPVPDAPRHVRDDAAPMMAKIGVMLAAADRPWTYAHGMARRMFGTQRVEWLRGDQMHKLIAALEYDKRRRRKGK